jgi:hypothetical protein
MKQLFSRFLKSLVATALICSSSNTYGLTIVIHGTFASSARWYQPGGEFFEQVRQSLQPVPLTKDKKSLNEAEADKAVAAKHKIISFSWSGKNKPHDRIEAARKLAELILSYPEDEPINIIAHSHGGNVAALASRFLYNPFADTPSMDEILKLDSNPQVATKSYYKKIVSDELDRLLGNHEGMKPFNIKQLNALKKDIKSSFSHFKKVYQGSTSSYIHEATEESRKKYKTTDPNNEIGHASTQRKINQLFLLGTPIHTGDYGIDMHVVNECYSLYSIGDKVQKVGFIYNRKHPSQKGLLNIQTYSCSRSGVIKNPSHSELHAPHIGKWLFKLPQQIKTGLELAPEVFDQCDEISAIFFEDGSEPIVSTEILFKSVANLKKTQEQPFQSLAAYKSDQEDH